jgi:hypothetical protein
MSPTLPNLTLLRLPKLRITNGAGWRCLDVLPVRVLMCVRRNMLMLEHSGYGDRYVCFPSMPRRSVSGDTTLSSFQGDV